MMVLFNRDDGPPQLKLIRPEEKPTSMENPKMQDLTIQIYVPLQSIGQKAQDLP
jgi:hypothetical protein